jgi:hypothetical protein
MRQIYTSPRVENVDRVVAMLNEAGIATSVTNRRAYAGHDYRRPSYAKPPDRDSWPQVWVVNATISRAHARSCATPASNRRRALPTNSPSRAANASPEARRKRAGVARARVPARGDRYAGHTQRGWRAQAL